VEGHDEGGAEVVSLVAQYILGDFPCAIQKSKALGTLCGYVGVPPCHPWYGRDDIHADVHGGVTYNQHEQVGHPAMLAYLRRHLANAQDMDRKYEGEEPMRDYRFADTWQRWLDKQLEHAGEWSEYPAHTGQDVWWVGFDCAHLGDLTPGPDNPPAEHAHLYPLSDGEGWYKDEAYVRQEIEGLARQAAEAQRMVAELEKP
jgi:hypothetical protein